jgi:diguanylate cyclase (GGDEF)-like protein
MLDLDRFKEVNDTYGHAAGDELLVAVGRAVSGLLGPDQMVARLGGDEFAVVLPGVAHGNMAERLADDIIQAVRAAAAGLPAGGAVGISVGIALCPGDAGDRTSLLGHADVALYHAKGDGRGVRRRYEAFMGEEARERQLAERDLRLALARDELRLVYQPQRDARTGAVAGVEALIRWDHPTRGEILPSGFLPMAEETGLIHPIGEWVLRRACRETMRTPGLRVAVNVSVPQVHSSRFADVVATVLAETGMRPELLELEVTESALVRDPERTLSTLVRLKELGVNVAMDDFGTGYSALSNLGLFPFDRIKIDRSFVRSVDADGPGAAIVRALLGLGRGLGLPVVAEGVETGGELSFLSAESCDVVQGYLVGRPAGPPQFSGLAGLAHAANLLPLAKKRVVA